MACCTASVNAHLGRVRCRTSKVQNQTAFTVILTRSPCNLSPLQTRRVPSRWGVRYNPKKMSLSVCGEARFCVRVPCRETFQGDIQSRRAKRLTAGLHCGIVECASTLAKLSFDSMLPLYYASVYARERFHLKTSRCNMAKAAD
jgi:hypothetical protein